MQKSPDTVFERLYKFLLRRIIPVVSKLHRRNLKSADPCLTDHFKNRINPCIFAARRGISGWNKSDFL